MKRIIVPILTVLVMSFIFFESSLPADLSARQSGFLAKLLGQFGTPEVTFWIRKAAHFTEFAVLGLLLSFLFERITFKQIQRDSARVLLKRILAFLTGAFYGATDEIHQLFVPGRSCELRDVGIDAAGVLFGVLIGSFFLFLTARRAINDEKGKNNLSQST